MVLTYKEIIEDKDLRIAYWERSFFFWFQYHYGFKCKWFHKRWMESIESDLNTMIVAYRASRKTTIVRWYVVYCAAYKKEPSIIRQSFEDSLSWESVREIAKMMCKKSVVEDHWMLFPFETKKDDLAKRSLTNFETTNWVKISSKSLGQTIRWSNTYDIEEEISARPTLLILDDIDVVKSVSNVEIINQNEKKILWETIAALDPLRRKIIFLGNVINEDWIVPRFYNTYKNSPNWNCFWQSLFEGGKNVWPEVFTDKVIETLKEDGKTSFNQNYLLVASTLGSWVFIRQYFDYFLLSDFERSDWILKKEDLRCWIFIDPAFSTSVTSDDAVVIWMWEHKITKWYYLIDWYADVSAPSRTLDAVVVMYNNMVANWFKPEFISVENVTINKEQSKFIDDLRKKLLEYQINVPIRLYETKVKKEDRIRFNLEGVMSQKWIKFNRNIPNTGFIAKMERQFLEFPNWDHDDVIDTVSQWIEVFRKRPEKSSSDIITVKYDNLLY